MKNQDLLNKKDFIPDGFGYKTTKKNGYIFTYGARQNKKGSEYFFEIIYKDSVINSCWKKIYTEKDAIQELNDEYKRMIIFLKDKEPLNKEGYSIVPKNLSFAELNVCPHCGKEIIN